MKPAKAQQVAKKFRELEGTLKKRFPRAIKEANRISKAVVDPRNATPVEIWKVIWPKPLFSNTKVEYGCVSVDKLRPFMRGAWRHWGKPHGKFLIRKVGLGVTVESFAAQTPLAQNIRAKTRIAMHRLYAIQGAAIALRKRVAQADLSKHPYKDLFGADISLMIPQLRAELKNGWGHITILHLLTDLGLACKPDLHVVRTVRHLGMSLDIPDRKVPNLVDSIKINHRVSALVEALYGKVTPKKLRYVDKILMDISRLGIIPGAKGIVREQRRCGRGVCQ